MMMILMILMTIGPEVDEEDPPPAVNHLQRQAQHQLGIFVIGVDDDWSFPLLMGFFINSDSGDHLPDEVAVLG